MFDYRVVRLLVIPVTNLQLPQRQSISLRKVPLRQHQPPRLKPILELFHFLSRNLVKFDDTSDLQLTVTRWHLEHLVGFCRLVRFYFVVHH